MRAFDIALFVALFGAVFGMVDGMVGSEWFYGYTAPDVDTPEYDMDQRYDMGDGIVSDTDEFSPGIFGTLSIVMNMLKGIFVVSTILSSIFFICDGSGGNVLTPFFSVIQIGVYIVYIWGVYQLVRGQGLKNYK